MTDKETKTTTEETVEETNATEQETEGKDFEFVEAPSFEVDYKGDCLYEVKVSIPAANEKKLSEDVLDELRQEAELPGFRRGRAPRKLLEKKFAKAVRSDVDLRLINAAFEKLIEEKELKPLSAPNVEDFEADASKRKDGDPLNFTLKFEVLPKIDLGKYRGLEVERPVMKTTDEDIARVIENTRGRLAVYETVEGIAAADGDQVIITFKGTVDGEEFPGGAAENYPYILGTKRFFPEFENALVGAKTDDTVACDVSFGDDYGAAHLRGKTAHFEITINEIKRRNLPDLNDEFAKQVGHDSLDAMKKNIEDRLKESAQKESESVARSRALEAIITGSTFELPKSLIESMARENYESKIKELREMRIPNAEIAQRDEELRTSAHTAAEDSIKAWVTVREIAEAEGIEVTDEDFEKEAAQIAARTGVAIDAVSKFLGESERRNSYELRMLEDKVMALVLAEAKITDKEVEAEELEKEAEA